MPLPKTELRKWEREVERMRGAHKTRETQRVELEKARVAANDSIEE